MTEPASDAPRRLRAADIIDAQQETIRNLTTRTATEPSASVDITRNAKGEVQFSVKVYSGADADPAAVSAATARAYDEATQAFDALAKVYPFGGGA